MMRPMRLHRVAIACLCLLIAAACGRSHVVREGGSSRPRGVDSPIRVSQPKYGATVVVQRGQNVYRIATENGLTALDLALWNDIPPPYTIHPGQRLRLYPGGQGGVATRPANPPKKPSTPTTTRSASPGASAPPTRARLAPGTRADLVLIDPRTPWRVNPDAFRSLSRNTPFAGWTLRARPLLTVCEGRTTFADPQLGVAH